MFTTLRKRLDQNEEGFTLIELMVVVLIIGILIAIAVPAFLGARERANDRAAQADLRNALTAQQTFFTDNQEYADATAIADIEPSLDFGTDPATGVQVQLGTASDAVCMARDSASGDSYQIYIGRTQGTYYGVNETCDETVAVDTAAPTGWQRDGFPTP